MAQIQPVIKCELDPTKPVPEICAVIQAVIPYHPDQELAILKGVVEAVERRIKQIEEVATSGQ